MSASATTEGYEFRPYHSSVGGFFGTKEECLLALEKEQCGDVLGPGDDGEHITLRECAECVESQRLYEESLQR